MAEELKYVASVVGFDKVEKALQGQKKALIETDAAVKKLSPSLFNLKEKLLQLQSAVFTEKDVTKIKKYNAEIVTTKKEMAALSTAGTSSFGALGAGATKAFSALRTISYILPGIGIAGILAFATAPIIDFISGLFEASEATKKLRKEQEDFKKVVEGIFESSGKEAAGVISLIAVLNSETETRKRKLDALEALKKINPEIFAGLKLEEGAVIGLDAAYKAYIENLKTVIAAKIKQQQIETVVTKLLQLQGITLTGNAKAFKNALDQQNAAEKKRLQSLGGAAAGVAKIMEQQETNAVNAIQALENEIKSLLSELTLLSKGIEVKVNTEKATKEVEKFFKAIRFGPTKGEFEIFNFETFAADVQKAFDKIKGQSDVFLQVPVSIVPSINTDNLADLERLAVIARLKATGVTKGIQDGLNIGVEGLRFPELKSLSESVKAQLASLTELMKATAVNAAVAIGEALGKAFTEGGSFIKNALGSVLSIMGEFLIQLGKAAIITSKLFLAIKASKVNPFTGIIGGILAIAAGRILKNIKLPSFATGVNNFSGGSAIVGERGREIVQLPRGANVIPANQTSSILGGQHITVGGYVDINGQMLRVVLQRADAQFNRNN